MKYYSFSRINKFEQCPHRFYKVYVEGKKESQSEPAVVGKIIHEAGAISLKTGRCYPVEQYLDLAKEKVAKEGKETKEIIENIDMKELNFLFNNFPVIPIEQTALIEKEVDVKIGDNLFAPMLKGVLDYYSGETSQELIDWKTGRTKANIMQLKVYAYMLYKSGVPVKTAKMFYVRDKKEDVITVTEEVIKEAETWLLEKTSEIEGKLKQTMFGINPLLAFPAKSNENCKYCSFKSQCPLSQLPSKDELIELNEDVVERLKLSSREGKVTGVYQSESGISIIKAEVDGQEVEVNVTEFKLLANKVDIPDEIRSLEEAQQIGSEIFRLEGIIKEYKSKLKQYVENNGDVTIGKKAFTMSKSESFKFTNDSLRDMVKDLIENGINPYGYLSLGKADVNKLLKKEKYTEEQLLKFAEKTERESFKSVSK